MQRTRETMGKVMRKLNINGARGATLLGFGLISLLFGVAYLGGPQLGAFALWPPTPKGVLILENLGGLRFWGCVWLTLAGYLFACAFRQDQTRAMAAFAFICALWGGIYFWGFLEAMERDGRSALWLSTGLFWALLVSCLGISRMLNAPPLLYAELRDKLDGMRKADDVE